jgi:Ca2+-binding EF-hand superfamily protein
MYFDAFDKNSDGSVEKDEVKDATRDIIYPWLVGKLMHNEVEMVQLLVAIH